VWVCAQTGEDGRAGPSAVAEGWPALAPASMVDKDRIDSPAGTLGP
jgi:hypothetical protein